MDVATSPTARTMQRCRDYGWMAGVVERWIGGHGSGGTGGPMVRKDLFGFVDLIAVSPDCMRFIQVTSGGNMSSRLEKIFTECREAALLLASQPKVEVEVWGWRKFKVARERRWWWAKRTAVRVGPNDTLYTYTLEEL